MNQNIKIAKELVKLAKNLTSESFTNSNIKTAKKIKASGKIRIFDNMFLTGSVLWGKIQYDCEDPSNI